MSDLNKSHGLSATADEAPLADLRPPEDAWMVEEAYARATRFRELSGGLARAVVAGINDLGDPVLSEGEALAFSRNAERRLHDGIFQGQLAQIAGGWFPTGGWLTLGARRAQGPAQSCTILVGEEELAGLHAARGRLGVGLGELIRRALRTAVSKPELVPDVAGALSPVGTSTVSVKLDRRLRDAIDARRGSTPRRAWIRHAVLHVPEEALVVSGVPVMPNPIPSAVSH